MSRGTYWIRRSTLQFFLSFTCAIFTACSPRIFGISLGQGSNSTIIGSFSLQGILPNSTLTTYQIPNSGEPYAVFAGDFNGDGYPDLASANRGSNEVSVSLSQGGGAFTTATAYAAGVNPSAVYGSDLDLDGDLDLVYSTYNDHLLHVRFNQGDGTFGVVTQYSAGSGTGLPILSMPADLNGDGFDDLIAAVVGDPGVAIRLNQGDGTFAAQTIYAMGTQTWEVRSADLDQDGDLDLVAINLGSNNLSVRLNQGDGTFGAQTTYATGTLPRSLDVKDIDADGFPDVVVGNETDSTISVRFNQGDGTLGAQTTYASLATFSTLLVDLNNDTYPDYVGSSTFSTGLLVRLNQGDGTFGAPSTYNTGTGSGQRVTSSDINLDGYVDLIVAAPQATQILVLVNRGNGSFYDSMPGGYTAANTNDITSGDLNQDGQPDLIYVTASNELKTRLNTGSGTYGSESTYPTGAGPANITLADLNGDTYSDVIVAEKGVPGSSGLSVFMNQGDGSLGVRIYLAIVTAHVPYQVSTGDLDMDGSPDILCTISDGAVSHELLVWLNDGSGSFARQSYSTGSSPTSIVSADFNNDGAMDLAISDNGGVFVRFNEIITPGTPTFGPLISTGIYGSVVAAGDVNGDGYLDLVGGHAGMDIYVALNDTAGGFTQILPSIGVVFGYTSMIFADYSGDGVPDLIYTKDNDTLAMRFVNGDGTFGAEITYPTGVGVSSVAAKDFNNDGWIDLVVTNTSADSIGVYLNGGGFYTVAVEYPTGDGPVAVASDDINQDGFMDIITVERDADGVSGFINLADGTFSSFDLGVTGVSDAPTSILLSDFNFDGYPDLALASRSQNVIEVRFNQLNGSFGPVKGYFTGNDPIGVLAVDTNQDGFNDLVTADYGSNQVTHYTNQGNESFLGVSPVQYALTGLPVSIAVADFEADGDIDVVVAQQGVNQASVLLNQGAGTFAAAVDYATGNSPTSISTQDANGDGLLDFVVSHSNEDYVSVYLNQGSGTFGAATDYWIGPSSNQIFSYDMDRDGFVDIISLSSSESMISIIRGQGDGSFLSPQFYYPPKDAGLVMTLTRSNADAYYDVAIAGQVDGIRILLNQVPQW
jgi:hypothetical protein